jgi:hypothetical protein
MLIAVLIALAARAAIWWPHERPSVFRNELPRIFELHDLFPVAAPFLFRDLERSLGELPQKLRQYRDVERDLQGLDTTAWTFLKEEVAPLLIAKNAVRSWEPVWNRLNQAKAYNYLKRSGYTHVAFIPPSAVKGKKTPDLGATDGTAKALCEVKTLNISDIEVERRRAAGVGAIEDQLNLHFLDKLGSTLRQAKAQLDAYDPQDECKKIAYLVINYDDVLHEYGMPYRLQIEQYLKLDDPAPGLQVELDMKEPYYAAMG